MGLPKPKAIRVSTQEPVVVPERFIEDDDDLVAFDFAPLMDVPRCYWKVESNAASEMTAQEKATVDIDAPAYKQRLYPAIDRRTVELIAQGFAHDGRQFSLSAPAQANWQRLKTWQIGGSMTFPVTVSTLDNGTYSIADAAAFDAFYQAMNDAVEGHIQSGRDQKAVVDAITTMGEVETYADPR